MTLVDLPLPHAQRRFLERFIAACAADERVLASLLGGSYARGSAEAHSDLDLSIIVADDHYDTFVAERAAFLGRLGALVFLEDFDLPNIVFLIYADGAEVELTFASPGRLGQIQCGPFRALYDRQGLLAHATFPPYVPTPEEQREALRRQMTWFWHDVSHFITAIARGHEWWAYGQLEELRRYCMNLARIQRDPLGEVCGHEKVDLALPAEDLASLTATCGPLEREALLQAGHALIQRYQELARPLVATRGLAYPAELERVMLARLARLSHG